MALPITIPYTFANATTTQNLSYLDADFATVYNAVNGIGNGTVSLSNVSITGGNIAGTFSISANSVPISALQVTGTANSTTYLRGDGSWATVSGGGSGTVTSINATSANGFSFSGGPVTTSGTLTLNVPAPGTSGNVLTSNGTVWSSSAGAYPLTSGTSVASTSGTSIDFTSIPSWVKRITVLFNGVSTNGTSNIQVQVGSGSVSTTSYYSSCWASNTTNTNSTSGILLTGLNAAGYLQYGAITLMLIASNTWVATSVSGEGAVASSGVGGGVTPALSGALDRVRITTVNGTDTFDAGSINILYE